MLVDQVWCCNIVWLCVTLVRVILCSLQEYHPSLVKGFRPTRHPPLLCRHIHHLLLLDILLVFCPWLMLLAAAVASVAFHQGHLVLPLRHHHLLQTLDQLPQCILQMTKEHIRKMMVLAWQALWCSHSVWHRIRCPSMDNQVLHLELAVCCNSWVTGMIPTIVSSTLSWYGINISATNEKQLFY